MNNISKAAAPSNAARNTTSDVVNNNQPVDVQTMSAEDRQALLAELIQAQQADVAPLKEQKRELLVQLAAIDKQIAELKPDNSPLAVYRAVYSAVKAGNKSAEDIAKAAELDTATVEATLKKHLVGKGDNEPIFTLKNNGYILTPKTKS